MSRNYLVQAHLEYLVEQGLKKGLTEKQAIDYANNIFFQKVEKRVMGLIFGHLPKLITPIRRKQ